MLWDKLTKIPIYDIEHIYPELAKIKNTKILHLFMQYQPLQTAVALLNRVLRDADGQDDLPSFVEFTKYHGWYPIIDAFRGVKNVNYAWFMDFIHHIPRDVKLPSEHLNPAFVKNYCRFTGMTRAEYRRMRKSMAYAVAQPARGTPMARGTHVVRGTPVARTRAEFAYRLMNGNFTGNDVAYFSAHYDCVRTPTTLIIDTNVTNIRFALLLTIYAPRHVCLYANGYVQWIHFAYNTILSQITDVLRKRRPSTSDGLAAFDWSRLVSPDKRIVVVCDTYQHVVPDIIIWRPSRIREYPIQHYHGENNYTIYNGISDELVDAFIA